MLRPGLPRLPGNEGVPVDARGKPFYWPQRKGRRLGGFDYSTRGAYFVTICTRPRRRILSRVEDSGVCLTHAGVIVLREWKRAVKLRPDVELDAFIIMPDHVHGIIRLRDANPDSSGHRKSSSVPGLIQQFKSVTTRLINRWRGTPGARVWQRSYHDWVIRSEGSLSRIRAYIRNNPAKWELKGRPVRLSI